MNIKEKKISPKGRLLILPAAATGISLLLIIFFLWPKVREYHRVRADYEHERSIVEGISGRWAEISRKENDYREIYRNLQEISRRVGKSWTKIDYMKIFIDRSHSSRVKIISFSQSREKTTDTRREITFWLTMRGRYKAIGNYLKYLESTYPIVDIQSLSIRPQSTRSKRNVPLNIRISGKIIFLI
ncbi:MAG: hypothetical protein GXO76_14600 [Calditrichaeota bacterium]|nr:hypothetical protein [Calditrichota bacterium]